MNLEKRIKRAINKNQDLEKHAFNNLEFKEAPVPFHHKALLEALFTKAEVHKRYIAFESNKDYIYIISKYTHLTKTMYLIEKKGINSYSIIIYTFLKNFKRPLDYLYYRVVPERLSVLLKKTLKKPMY